LARDYKAVKTGPKRTFESFCRVCGIIVEDAFYNQKYCGDILCEAEAQRMWREKRTTESIGKNKEARDNHRAKVMQRGWTAGGVDHLYNESQALRKKGLSEEKIIKALADETHRDPEIVRNMLFKVSTHTEYLAILKMLEPDMQVPIESQEDFYD